MDDRSLVGRWARSSMGNGHMNGNGALTSTLPSEASIED